MAKKRKKKKKRNPQSSSVAVAKGSEGWIEEQRTALSSGKARRASVLGERIFEDVALEESVRRRFLAVGHEAYLRGLLSKGNVDQARSRARKLLGSHEWMGDFFALSLQLRLGLAEVQDDRGWMDRLRAELVDPADLCGVESGGLGAHAQRVLDAWSLVERGEDAAALELLRSVGRRSPLVDWRLFVQVLIAVGRQDRAEADSMVKRMREGCPARATAESLLVSSEQSVGVYTRRLRLLVKKGQERVLDFSALEAVVRYALADRRPGLALTLMTSFGLLLKSPSQMERYFALIDRVQSGGFSVRHIDLRMAVAGSSDDAVLQQNTLESIRESEWSAKETVRLWCRVFEQVRRRWSELKYDLSEWELDMALEEFLLPFFADCHRLTQNLPAFHEAYQFWVWLEKEVNADVQDGMQAYVNAFPKDVDVLTLAIPCFVEAGAFSKAERCLTSLKKAGVSADAFHALQQGVVFHRVRVAFENDAIAQVEKWGVTYSGTNFAEKVQVAFMRWRVATKGNKRKLGIELAELKSPWVVLFYAVECEWDFKLTQFPAAVKRSLADDPTAVLRGFLDLYEHDPAHVVDGMNPVLYRALIKALNHSEASVVLFRPVLSALLLRMNDPYEVVSQMDGAMGAFQALLAGCADDQAVALALRIRMLSIQSVNPLKEDKVDRSMRVAWTLAASDDARSIISRVNSKMPSVPKEILKKPATEKMIHAELKMHLKFVDFRQMRERYEPPYRDEVMGGMNATKSYIEKLIEKMEKKQASEESSDVCPSEVEPENYFQPKSRPFVFSNAIPSTEMEFEQIIQSIRQSTRGSHREKAAATLGEMIEQSSFSDKTKARLMKKQQGLMEGE